MNSYQERLEDELFSLSDKMQKLMFFFDSETFKNLAFAEKVFLEKQLELMNSYAEHLQARIKYNQGK